MQPLKIDGYIGRDEGYFSLRDLDNYLASLPKEEKELTYEINSGGGSVIEGWAIHDRLKDSGFDLTCKIIGQCSSIATVIAMAAKPENRYMSANADFGIHFPYLELERNEVFEAQELINVGNDLMHSQKKILDLYVNETGQPKELIETMMAHSKSLSAPEAKKFGFVKNITADAKNVHKYRIAAFIHTNKNTDMEFSPTQKSWIEQKFTDFANKFENLFKPVFKAMAIDLESGAKIWIDSEDGEFVGKKAFLADAEGNKTNDPATDGEHKLKDGRTITVKEGTVTAVAEATAAAPDETAALKAKVAELTAQLETEKAAKAQVETTKAELETNVVAMKKELTEFKAMVLGKDIPGAGQTFKGDQPQLSDDQKWLALKRAKAAKEAELKAKKAKP